VPEGALARPRRKLTVNGVYVQDIEKKLAQEIARYDREVVSLEEVSAKTVKLLNRLVDGLTNEAFGDTETALKNRVVPESLVKKLKEVKSCLAAAVQSEVVLRKTIKLRSQELSREQRLAGIRKHIIDMPWLERRAYIVELVKAHNERRSFETEAGIDPADQRKLEQQGAMFIEVL
jgi:hypothetical protein